MEKKLKDYLHLYLGVECETPIGVILLSSVELHSEYPCWFRYKNTYDYKGKPDKNYHVLREQNWCGKGFLFSEVKPILRPLSSMTEEEAIELYCITTPYRVADWDKDKDKYDITYMTDCKLGKDHPNYKQVFAIQVVDLRTPHDYMNVNLNFDILRYNHEQNEDPTINQRLHNQHEATRFLLSKHFDLFGLIETGLAIDQTTLQIKTKQ